LAQQGLTFADYQSLLENNVRGLKVVNQVAPLPKKPQPGPMQPVAHVRHILVALKPQGKPVRSDKQAHAEAERILAQIKHGADFTALAKKYSDDTGSAQRGGVYDVHPHEMVPQFEHASFTFPLHHPAIVKTDFGYHIIEVLSRGKARAQSLSPQQIQEQHFTSWINKQMKRASIKRIAKVTA
jgi:parvulin-like peptidyl-prolyl isomerase